jgi:hypothetical protein
MLIISSIDAKEKLILELIGFDKQTELFEFEFRFYTNDNLSKFYQGWEAESELSWIIKWLKMIVESPFSNLDMETLPLKIQFHHTENGINFYLITFSNDHLEDSESKFDFNFLTDFQANTSYVNSALALEKEINRFIK